MDKVTRLGNDNNLDNIPHMLRNLAADLDSGETPMPRNVLVIAVYDGDAPPPIFGFGDGLGRLADIGALTAAAHFLMQMESAP